MTPLVLGWEEVEHGQSGEGGEVPDGLYPGGGPPYLQERFRPGPKSQIILLHDIGVPQQRHPEETHQVPWAAHAAPSTAPNHTNEIGRNFCGPTEGNTEAKGVGRAEE